MTPDQETDNMALWLVEVVMPSNAGIMLWGPVGPDDTDRVLALSGRALLFDSMSELRKFARSDAESSFAGDDTYERWRITEGEYRVATRFDLVEIAGSLSLAPYLWDLGRASATVDGMNFLGDIARSVGLEPILDQWALGPVGELLDALTFATEEDLAEVLSATPPRRALNEYLRDLGAIESRLVRPGPS